MSEKIFVSPPPPPTTYKNDPSAKISDAEEVMYSKVLEHFCAAEYKLPGLDNDAELTEAENFWLTRECLLRFLRASKWKVPTAIERLEVTLKWRREFGIYDKITAEHVEPEAVTGKMVVFGYDNRGKPALYLIPSRQNTNESPRQVEYVFWALERCIELMEPGIETIALLINFAERGRSPSMTTSHTVLNILQTHYPERLGLSLIINIPFIVNAFFKIILPFVDPTTRQKIKLNPSAINEGYFSPNQIMSQWWEGEKNFEYEHDKYWPSLVKICAERRAVWLERWKELGGKIGIREWDYKSGSTGTEVVTPDEKAYLNTKSIEKTVEVDATKRTVQKDESSANGQHTTEANAKAIVTESADKGVEVTSAATTQLDQAGNGAAIHDSGAGGAAD